MRASSSGLGPMRTLMCRGPREPDGTAFAARAGGAVCADCGAGALPVSEAGFVGVRTLLERPLAAAQDAGLGVEGLRPCLRVVESLYEEHGGFRLKTLARTR